MPPRRKIAQKISSIVHLKKKRDGTHHPEESSQYQDKRKATCHFGFRQSGACRNLVRGEGRWVCPLSCGNAAVRCRISDDLKAVRLSRVCGPSSDVSILARWGDGRASCALILQLPPPARINLLAAWGISPYASGQSTKEQNSQLMRQMPASDAPSTIPAGRGRRAR